MKPLAGDSPSTAENKVTGTAFEQLAEKVLAELPAEFADRLHNLVILVEDRADAELLAAVDFDDPLELLGFYDGIPLTERSQDQLDIGPDRIFLFREAIEAESHYSGMPIEQVIRETLWHEIAHYFGFSEEEMERIEVLWAGEE